MTLSEVVGKLKNADVALILRAEKQPVGAGAYVADDFMLDFFRSTVLT